jgi:adenylosuccinate lyase
MSLKELSGSISANKFTGRAASQVEEFIENYINPILEHYKETDTTSTEIEI